MSSSSVCANQVAAQDRQSAFRPPPVSCRAPVAPSHAPASARQAVHWLSNFDSGGWKHPNIQLARFYSRAPGLKRRFLEVFLSGCFGSAGAATFRDLNCYDFVRRQAGEPHRGLPYRNQPHGRGLSVWPDLAARRGSRPANRSGTPQSVGCCADHREAWNLLHRVGLPVQPDPQHYND